MKNFLISKNQPMPEYLIRHFEEAAYAEEFIKGNIRLGFYKTYASLSENDIRHNNYEGKYSGAVKYNDGKLAQVNFGGTWPLYIICFFNPQTSISIRKRHGGYSLKINQPLQLYNRIGNHIASDLQASWSGHMVYGHDYVQTTQDEISQSILPLSIYSDSLANKDKKEIRFSYYFNANAIWAKTNEHKLFTPSLEKIILNSGIELPKYINLNGVQVADLCETL